MRDMEHERQCSALWPSNLIASFQKTASTSKQSRPDLTVSKWQRRTRWPQSLHSRVTHRLHIPCSQRRLLLQWPHRNTLERDNSFSQQRASHFPYPLSSPVHCPLYPSNHLQFLRLYSHCPWGWQFFVHDRKWEPDGYRLELWLKHIITFLVWIK